jgi:Putative prokaryotic signal transducing protein
VVVWYGDDPVSFSAILAALKENDVPTYDMAAHSHLISYEPGMLRPQYAIFVHADQTEEARKLIIELLGKSPRQV